MKMRLFTHPVSPTILYQPQRIMFLCLLFEAVLCVRFNAIQRIFKTEAKRSLRASNSLKNAGGNAKASTVTLMEGEKHRHRKIGKNDHFRMGLVGVRFLLVNRGLTEKNRHFGCEVCTWQIKRRSVMIEGIERTNPHISKSNLAEWLDKWGHAGLILEKLYLMHSQKQSFSAISAGMGD